MQVSGAQDCRVLLVPLEEMELMEAEGRVMEVIVHLEVICQAQLEGLVVVEEQEVQVAQAVRQIMAHKIME
jgi:hypothetical protein